MVKKLDLYLFKETLPPFLVSLLIYSFVLLMNQVFLFAELLISKRVELRIASELLFDLLPGILAFTIPMATATGILAAMSRISSDWEIMAMKTLGIGLGRLAQPLFFFAFLSWLVTSAFTLYLAPHFNDRWVRLLTEAVVSRVQFQIVPREFNESIPQTVLFIQEIDSENIWSKVLVHRRTDDQLRMILAKRGRINVFPEAKRALLELWEGEIHIIPLQEPERHSVASFERHEEEVDVTSLFPELSRQKRVREKNIMELFHDSKKIEIEIFSFYQSSSKLASSSIPVPFPESERRKGEWRSHQVEIHKRFSLPLVCFLFVLIGLPLGVSTRRGGRASGFTLSLVIILIYYILITGGEKAAVEGRLSPWLGMWGPNLIFLLISLFLFLKEAREEKIRLKFGQFGRAIHYLKSKGQRFLPSRRKVGMPLASSPLRRRRLFFPAILDRYLMRRFGFIYLLVALAFIFISVIVTIFERLDNIYEHNKPFLLLWQYVGYRLPEFLMFILPLAGLTTTLLTLGLLEKTNEVTAVKACGISLYRVVGPILGLAIIISAISFYIQEYIAPYANRRAEEIWNRINDAPPRTVSVLDRRWIFSQDGRTIYHFSYFDPVAEVFQKLALFRLNLDRWELIEITQAEKAKLAKHELTLLNGWQREFLGERLSPFFKFKETSRLSAEGADYFVKERKEPSWMNWRELKKHIQEVERMGFQTHRLKVDLYSKLSFPLVSLVMVLLGIPFAFTMGRRGVLVGVGLSIILAIIYWSVIGFMKNLGYVDIIPPFLAAWGSEFLFGSVALFFISRLRT